MVEYSSAQQGLQGGISDLALELRASDHLDRRAETPSELGAVDLLPELDLAVSAEFVPEPKERMHKCQVETPLRTALKLLHEVLVRAPVFFPCRWTFADRLSEVSEGRDVDGRLGRVNFGSEEGVEAVVEVGKEEDLAMREGLEEGGLVYTVERARLDLADPIPCTLAHTQERQESGNVRILSHDQLHDPVAGLIIANILAPHRHVELLAHPPVVDLHQLLGPLRQARACDDRVLAVARTAQAAHELDEAVHVLASDHEPVPEVRVLVQHARRAVVLELVLVLALLERRVRLRHVERRLEHDLRRRPAQVEHRVRLRRLVVLRERLEQVVRRQPRIHALVAALHDLDRIRPVQAERIVLLEPSPHRLEDVPGLLRAKPPEPRRRLHLDRRALAQGLGHDAQCLRQELVEALRRGSWVPAVRREARLALLEHLVLVRRRWPAVVELVDVDARARRARIDHERELHERDALLVRLGAVVRLR